MEDTGTGIPEWLLSGSNRRPCALQAHALPTELNSRMRNNIDSTDVSTMLASIELTFQTRYSSTFTCQFRRDGEI